VAGAAGAEDRSISIPGKVFFSTVERGKECAIKLARNMAGKRYEIITMLKSFHGRTMACISAQARKK